MSLHQEEQQSQGAHAFQGQAMAWRLRNEVLEIELYREPCNEIGTILLEELEALLRTLDWIAHRTRALLFYSSVKKGFCAGADLRELRDGLARADQATAGKGYDPTTTASLRSFIERIHRAFRRLDLVPLPTVAALHGFCFGGGFELALACDVLVADRSTRFCFPELRLGLIPGFGGIPRLRRKVGENVVLDLLLSGRSIQAKRAQELGLVSQVVARGESLQAARRLCEQMTHYDRAAVHEMKRFTKDTLDEALQAERDIFLKLLNSPTVRAALEDFVDRKDAHPYLPRGPSDVVDIDML